VSESPTLLYLEADDEITAVVRRVRAADAGRVIVVAPGRSRATSSAVALRLLARAAEADEREIAVVGDALTRSLAAEASIEAYATVDEARRGDPAPPPAASDAAHATIHVVRGPATEDSAPTLAAVTVAATAADDVTRPVPVVGPAAKPRAARLPARVASGRRLPMALLGAIALLVVGTIMVGATLLPAATITIAPRSETIEPVADSIVVDEPQRIAGTAEATATVTATGSYEVNDAATGAVVFFNFNFFDVEVPAGSLVATGSESGDQAFATAEAIVVPAGSFDPILGGITAGETPPVAVTAAATGEGGNVAAGTIDTVLDPGLAGQLRGFPTIDEPLVTNPAAMTGGVAASGVEIIQQDVDAALAQLHDALQQQVDDALAETGDALYADAGEPPAPQITGDDELVGTRDPEAAEISGTLAYDRLVADPAAVEAAAIERFSSDPAHVPEGWQLLDGATTVEIGEAQRSGEAEMTVDVSVTGRAAPMIDADGVVARITGLTPEEVEVELADIGAVSVDLWPGWVGTVPGMEWRIKVLVADQEALEP
jgi:hypothetical protein